MILAGISCIKPLWASQFLDDLVPAADDALPAETPDRPTDQIQLRTGLFRQGRSDHPRNCFRTFIEKLGIAQHDLRIGEPPGQDGHTAQKDRFHDADAEELVPGR